jgi:hypothetical protein
MTERNRVTPFGDVKTFPLRGAWTGNRGRLHVGQDIRRFHATNSWVTCSLEFAGRFNEQWQPHHYTFLFFHDEAVSLAAGHRPCAECRRASYNAYREAWSAGRTSELPGAKELNRQLHAERLYAGTHRRRAHHMAWVDLPDGTFVASKDTPFLVFGDRLVKWSERGYLESDTRPRAGHAWVITPPSSVHALANGYRAQIDAAVSSLDTNVKSMKRGDAA